MLRWEKVIHQELFKPESIQVNGMHKILWDFQMQTDHLIPSRRPDFVLINKKKKRRRERTCQVDFTVPADHRVKIKERKKRVKYLSLTKELKKTVEHAGDGVFGTVSKGLKRGLALMEIGGRIETIQITVLLRSACGVLNTRGDLLSLLGKPTNAGRKNTQWVKLKSQLCVTYN